MLRVPVSSERARRAVIGVLSGFKSVILKVVDPIFRKDGRTVVPLRIGGTRANPSFGLDVKRVFSKGK